MTHTNPARSRMTGTQRREQLIEVGRALFADRGVEGTTVEEIAATAEVSKPVVYEHFGGKEGLYAVVVDRETNMLLSIIESALTSTGSSRVLVERAALGLLTYVETNTDGFRILVRDSAPGGLAGSYASLISDIATQVEYLLARAFQRQGLDPEHAPLYAQMLVGMVAMVAQWWLDQRQPEKEAVAAHVVNLAWNGLQGLTDEPRLSPQAFQDPR